MKLFHSDGAAAQARACLAYLQDGYIEASWDETKLEYTAEPTVARWHNCREQGYVISLSTPLYTRQLNIAFFEHRNNDELCAVKWEQFTINPPTIYTIPATAYPNKWAISHTEPFNHAYEMASWILTELNTFWKEHA